MATFSTRCIASPGVGGNGQGPNIHTIYTYIYIHLCIYNSYFDRTPHYSLDEQEGWRALLVSLNQLYNTMPTSFVCTYR